MYRKSEAKKSNLLRSGPYLQYICININICSKYIFINRYNNNSHIGQSDRLSKRVGEGLRRSPWCQYQFDAGVFSYQNMTGGEGQALHSSQSGRHFSFSPFCLFPLYFPLPLPPFSFPFLLFISFLSYFPLPSPLPLFPFYLLLL